MVDAVIDISDIDERPDYQWGDYQPEDVPLSPERLAPHSADAEEALLGSALINGELLASLGEMVETEDFFIARNGIVWDALMAIFKRGDHVDELTVIDELQSRQQLAEIGGPAFVTRLITHTPTYMHAATYAALIDRASIRRQLIAGASKIVAAAQNPNMDINEVAQTVGEIINPLIGNANRNALRIESAHDVFSDVYDDIQEWNADPRDVRGWRMGIDAVDQAFGGIENGTLTGILAHTGQGKSTLMGLTILALAQQGTGVVCPTEMPTKQYALRLLAYQAGTSGSTLRKGKADEETHGNVTNAYLKLSNMDFDFLPGKPTPKQLYAFAERKQQQGRCDWIVIDGLHDMTPSDKKASGVYERVTNIIEGVHDITSILKIPIWFTLHVNRSASSDMSKPPTIQQAVGSSRIEQLLSQALVMWRPAGLVEQGALARLPDGYGPESTDIIIAKSRLERTGARLKMRLVQSSNQFGFYPEVR
jgi:replicative DNA helicase